MSESSTGTGGDESRPITDQPLPNDDDWEDAPSEGETEVKNAFLLAPPAYHGDRLFYRVVVWALAIVAVGALAGGMVLAGMGKDVPDTVLALGSAAVGALAGVLAGNRNQT